MANKLQLKSNFLNSLNTTIQKLIVENNVSVVKSPFMEADGKFTSIVSAPDKLDNDKIDSSVSLNSMAIDDNEPDEEKSNEKATLAQKVVDAIQKTLDSNTELQSILNKIKKLNDENTSDIWTINKKDNTAELKSKGAQIFRQNNNICLSIDGKVHLFKTVNELHNFLEKHHLPLPKNIKLKESSLDDLLDDYKQSLTYKNKYKVGDKLSDEDNKELEADAERDNASDSKLLYRVNKKDYDWQWAQLEPWEKPGYAEPDSAFEIVKYLSPEEMARRKANAAFHDTKKDQKNEKEQIEFDKLYLEYIKPLEDNVISMYPKDKLWGNGIFSSIETAINKTKLNLEDYHNQKVMAALDNIYTNAIDQRTEDREYLGKILKPFNMELEELKSTYTNKHSLSMKAFDKVYENAVKTIDKLDLFDTTKAYLKKNMYKNTLVLSIRIIAEQHSKKKYTDKEKSIASERFNKLYDIDGATASVLRDDLIRRGLYWEKNQTMESTGIKKMSKFTKALKEAYEQAIMDKHLTEEQALEEALPSRYEEYIIDYNKKLPGCFFDPKTGAEANFKTQPAYAIPSTYLKWLIGEFDGKQHFGEEPDDVMENNIRVSKKLLREYDKKNAAANQFVLVLQGNITPTNFGEKEKQQVISEMQAADALTYYTNEYGKEKISLSPLKATASFGLSGRSSTGWTLLGPRETANERLAKYFAAVSKAKNFRDENDNLIALDPTDPGILDVTQNRHAKLELNPQNLAFRAAYQETYGEHVPKKENSLDAKVDKALLQYKNDMEAEFDRLNSPEPELEQPIIPTEPSQIENTVYNLIQQHIEAENNPNPLKGELNFLKSLNALKQDKKYTYREFNDIIDELTKAAKSSDPEIDVGDDWLDEWQELKYSTAEVKGQEKFNAIPKDASEPEQTTKATRVKKTPIAKESTFFDAFSSLIGQSLKEDDSPEDFATNLNNMASSTTDSSTFDTDTSDLSSTSYTPPTVSDDFSTDDGTAGPTQSFGDVNISAGDYSPDEATPEDMPVPEPDMPEYKIIDILINDTDDSDIQVKVQNIETGEIETRSLDEIDV